MMCIYFSITSKKASALQREKQKFTPRLKSIFHTHIHACVCVVHVYFYMYEKAFLVASAL